MPRRRLHRGVGLLLAPILASVALAAQAVPAAAAANGSLFAVRSAAVVTVDPASGAQTTVVDLSSLGLGRYIDPLIADQTSGHLLGVVVYCLCGRGGGVPVDQLFNLDSQNGTYQLSPVLSTPIGDGIALDPSTQNLWAISACTDCTDTPIVRIDPISGAETTVASITSQGTGSAFFVSMALAPAANRLYITFSLPGGSAQLFELDTMTGILSNGPALAQQLKSLLYDTSSGTLLGITSAPPQQLLRVDPVTGGETAVATFSAAESVTKPTVDPGSNTVFAMDSNSNDGTLRIVSINDVTGSSTFGAPLPDNLTDLAFQPVLITPVSIKADVRSAFASGAIANAGVAVSLLAKLNAAEAARSRGHCATAGNTYTAFVAELTGLRGKMVASATANQLISEAQFLIANCP